MLSLKSDKLKVHSYLVQFMTLLPKIDDKAPEMGYQPPCSLYQQVNTARLSDRNDMRFDGAQHSPDLNSAVTWRLREVFLI
jgi:hypothetical protein